jgi:hypothetical protein
MTLQAPSLTTMLVIVGLAIAPAVQAKEWHGHYYHYHGHPYHGNYHHGSGNAAAAAIVGGLIGLGIGAAIASGAAAPPPPVYYGAPPGYYAPPPGVYYGY